ncbi:protein ABHD18-like [Acanthaster planci]|uniref:Protein ABHD18-like n=1 Tax=Acanthaster planci TaxID=133434 RepID=A0A8B7Z498_ACAPL|nr:protein ABHD18-like [Acanthaster planci]XP_022099610.1 protein ABHD18-like [Acanthaster planci]XP_022099611.1 protein ABHD18-like [Acanthaster planci]
MLAKASKLDVVWRKLLLTKFFTKGWGSVDNLKRMCKFGQVISDRSRCKLLVDKTYPVFIDKNEQRGECRILEGHFVSPFAKYIKGIMPKEVETARFQVILPSTWKSERKPICIHLAGTGDHGFWRRRTIMARPLLKEHGIASIILENPFYGLRKPKEQSRSSLLNVSDLFVMGGALVLETLTLLHWCEKEGYGPLGVSGISMGGHMATLAVTNWHKPIALIPCLSWSNATPTFTQGVMSGSIPWETLASEYVFHSEYEAEILRKLMKCPQYDAYRLGQEFAANFPESMEELQSVTLKSGVRCSCQNQRKPDQKTTASASQDGQGYVITSPDDMGNVEPNQQSSQCNVASKVESVPRDKDQYQSSSIPKTEKDVPSSRDICQKCSQMANTNGASDTDYQCMRTQNRSRDGTESSVGSFSDGSFQSDSDGDSSKTNTCRQNASQPPSDSASSLDSVEGTDNRKREVNEQVDGTVSSTRVGDPKVELKAGDKVKGTRKQSKQENEALRNEALQFMKGVMDAATFVGNFSKPVDPELVLTVLANQDAYIPWYQMPSLKELWPGMEVRYVNSGHVAAILFKQHHFRRAIRDAFQKMEKKYRGVLPEES